MIVGNGMLAKAMRQIDNDDLLIFASGVSNSMESRESAYLREFHLLQEMMSQHSNAKLIYFSTCSINDYSKKGTAYTNFKLKVEQFIKENSASYLILRVGNVVGKSDNPNTLINFLKNSIVNHIEFDVFVKAKRLLILIDDLVNFIKQNQDKFQNEIVDLYYPYQYSVLEIVREIERKIGIKGNYKLKEVGAEYELKENLHLNSFFKEESPNEYLTRAIELYC